MINYSNLLLLIEPLHKGHFWDPLYFFGVKKKCISKMGNWDFIGKCGLIFDVIDSVCITSLIISKPFLSIKKGSKF